MRSKTQALLISLLVGASLFVLLPAKYVFATANSLALITDLPWPETLPLPNQLVTNSTWPPSCGFLILSTGVGHPTCIITLAPFSARALTRDASGYTVMGLLGVAKSCKYAFVGLFQPDRSICNGIIDIQSGAIKPYTHIDDTRLPATILDKALSDEQNSGQMHEPPGLVSDAWIPRTPPLVDFVPGGRGLRIHSKTKQTVTINSPYRPFLISPLGQWVGYRRDNSLILISTADLSTREVTFEHSKRLIDWIWSPDDLDILALVSSPTPIGRGLVRITFSQ